MIAARLFCVVAAVAFAAGPSAARTPQQVADAALSAAPVWDGHNDFAEQLRDLRRNQIDGFDAADTAGQINPRYGRAAYQTDLNRLRKGRVGAQFWSVYVDFRLSEPQAVQAALEQIDLVKRLIARHPGQLQFVTTAAGAEQAMRAGRIASLIGMEGGGSIGGSLAVLRQMHALGARSLTLAHYKSLDWADSSNDAPKSGGLSPFGRSVVREMQRLGMLVDLSHASEETMLDALDEARAPVVFTHSNARALAAHPRNVPDGVLDRVRANGGLVMVTAVPSFLSDGAREWAARRAAEEARLKAMTTGFPGQVAPALAAWDAANPEPAVPLARLADHIDYIAGRIGADHVGLGADFDGGGGIAGFTDVAAYPALFAELARRGYSQGDLEKIASRNMMRVLRAAEAHAATRRADPPEENPTTF